MGLLDEVKQSVQQMDPETLRKRVLAIEEQKVKRQAAMKERNATLTPEEKEKRNERAKAYREKNGDKFKEARKAYNTKPEVIERRKAYMKRRNETNKLILQRAKEMGIIGGATAAGPQA